MKHYSEQKALYLQLSCRTFGMVVDVTGCPPSKRGLIRQMQRQGLLEKSREIRSKRCSRSRMKITKLGIHWLRKRKPEFKAWGITKEEYEGILQEKAA